MSKNTEKHLSTEETLKIAIDGLNSVTIIEERELTEVELNLCTQLRLLLTEAMPVAPRITGKKVQIAAELDLAVPAERDRWFRSLGMDATIDSDMIPGKTSKGKNGYVAAVLLVNGQEVGRIASENAMELMFFGGMEAAYTIWKAKGVKDPSSDGVSGKGRMPGKEILTAHSQGMTVAQIATLISREETAVAEWLSKNI